MRPRDRIALVIATGVVSWGLVYMVMLGIRGGEMGKGGAEIFLAIAVGLVNALGMYFATKSEEPPK